MKIKYKSNVFNKAMKIMDKPNNKSIGKACVFLFFMLISVVGISAEKVLKVVVLGSSTAAGSGAGVGQGWVAKYTAYLKGINTKNELINLAVGGYSTYNIMQDGNSVVGRPSPNVNKNITRALSYSPDVIIVNMPSNDVNAGYLTNEVLQNYATLKSLADAANVQIYFTTTQPRNMDAVKKQQQIDIKDATIATYPDRYIDFWTGLAESDGSIKSDYDSGDGIHLNNAGHAVLYDRVVAASDILTFAKDVVLAPSSEEGRILIDFGWPDQMATGNWNNVTKPRDVGTSYAVALKNTNNQYTPFKIYIHDAFNDINSDGVKSNSVLDYPALATGDSFYGNTVEFNDREEPTAGVTIDDLDMDKLYSFRFFAARLGVSDNRETKYIVKGKTTREVLLNAAGNTSNTVLVEDIEPDTEGKIVIDVTYGSANSHSNKFYYLGVLDIEYKPKSISAMGRILIDFGGTGDLSTGNWNNVTGPRQVGETYAVSLKNTENQNTPFKIYIHDAFNDVNYTGIANGVTVLDYPNSAANNSFYGNTGIFNNATEPTAGVTLDNLDMDNLYSLKFFAGRNDVNASDNREAKYIVKGKTTQEVYLNALNNTATVSAENVEPDEDGRIVIDVTYGEGNTHPNKFYYLGILDIEYKPRTTPVQLLGFNVSGNINHIDLNWITLSETNNSHFEIYRAGSNKKFELIFSVPSSSAVGNNTYYYRDDKPFSGINYYFLRQIDIDGAYHDYDVKSINFGNKSNDIHAYIRTGTNKLMISGEEGYGQGLEVSVLGIDGRLLVRKEISFREGGKEVEIATLVSKGIYVVTVKQSNKVFVHKVLY